RSPSHRRPSGEPPPLPRNPGWGRLVLVLGAVLVVGIVLSVLFHFGIAETAGASAIRSIQDAAPRWLGHAGERVDVVGGIAFVFALRLASAVVAVAFKRWRHLVVVLASFVLVDWGAPGGPRGRRRNP